MTKETLFSMWAPPVAIWSKWARPVIFAHFRGGEPAQLPVDPALENAWTPALEAMAVIIDLPGALSVDYALKLAGIGYRPVPLYNAAPSPRGAVYAAGELGGYSSRPSFTEVVDVSPILYALAANARNLPQRSLAPDAPPAFMLDALRRIGSTANAPGRFDNRSMSFPTDFPSAAFLLSQGIAKALVIQMNEADPQADLSHTLLRWQEAGIEIYSSGLVEGGQMKPIKVKKPSMFRQLWYRLSASMGLRRNPLGGFGAMTPFPSESGYGGG
jgi:hypothetical protein